MTGRRGPRAAVVVALFAVLGAALALAGGGGDAAGIVLVLAFVALSFVAAGRLAQHLLRGFNRTDVLEQGVPGTAVVSAIRETGTSVNDNPMPEFELQVSVPGRTEFPATVKQVLPRLLLGRVGPGTAVPVRVHGDEVAIDFAALASGAGAPAGGVVDTRAFLETAVPGEAEIDEMAETERSVTDPATGQVRRVFSFVLTVRREGTTPYQARLLQAVPPEHVGRIGPGATVPVGVAPGDPGDVAIDWRAYRAPA